MSMAYIQMFLKYCRENTIWFAVCGDGTVEEITFCQSDNTVEPDGAYEFGSERAYNWLVNEHRLDAAAMAAERKE